MLLCRSHTHTSEAYSNVGLTSGYKYIRAYMSAIHAIYNMAILSAFKMYNTFHNLTILYRPISVVRTLKYVLFYG